MTSRNTESRANSNKVQYDYSDKKKKNSMENDMKIMISKQNFNIIKVEDGSNDLSNRDHLASVVT